MHTLQGTPTLQHCGRTFFDSVFSTALAFSSFSAAAAGAVSGSSAHPAQSGVVSYGLYHAYPMLVLCVVLGSNAAGAVSGSSAHPAHAV